MKTLVTPILIFIIVSTQMLSLKAEDLPRLIIAGSTTILPLSEQLASKYKKKVGVDVLVQGGGSSAGIKAVRNDVAQIAASSRNLSEEEKKDLKPYAIARDAIAIIVHPSNKIKNVTMKQLQDILSGKITSWKELGGADKPIQLVNDSAGAGTRAALEELVMGKNKEKNIKGTPVTLKSVVVNSSAEMKASIAHSKYGLGYLPFNYLDSSVKTLSINGITASYAGAHKGEYPLFRDLYYAIKKDNPGLGLAYIYYVLSPEGQDIVVQEGFLPINLITSIEDLDRIMKREE